MDDIICWKYDGARFGPNGNLQNWNIPQKQINAKNTRVPKLTGAW
jgi:hypothetical protein